ncbi:MAG: PH domain-containing protein [Sporolactobacillus sp.]
MQKKQLNSTVVTIWFQRATITHLILALLIALAFLCADQFSWYAWLRWLLIGLALLCLPSYLLSCWIIPKIRYHTFFYTIRSEDILIQEGVFVVRQIVIPFSRVQNVSTGQGPLLRRHQLLSVAITTAAGSHEIPALDEHEAETLRDQISVLIKEGANREL